MSNKPVRGRQKHRKAPVAAAVAAPLKVVIRRLPPNLPENIFHTSIATWHKAMDWSDYVTGILADGRDKSDIFSRAYVKFRKHVDLLDFVKKYQGHLFIAADGKEYRAQVEVALYQRIPKPIGKSKDPLNGTLEEDSDYLAFLETLKAPPLPRKDENLAVSKVTPLIEFLRVQKAKSDAKAKARKAREAATKAKQAEEKKKAAQASADAVTAKIQEKRASEKPKGKVGNKSKNVVDAIQDGESKKDTKKPKAPRVKKIAEETVPATAKAIAATKVKQPQAAHVPPEKKRIPKTQVQTNGKVAANQTSNQDHGKATKAAPKKPKRKDGKQSTNNNNTANKKENVLDISGPTPAEMAALARTNT